MIELRWFKEKAGVYDDGLVRGEFWKDAVLQYRTAMPPEWPRKVEWSEWMEVPTVWDKDAPDCSK